MVVAASRITGNTEVKKLLAAPGNLSSGMNFGWKVCRGAEWIFFTVRANKGPATIMAGMATTIPYINVRERSALNCATSAVGEGAAAGIRALPIKPPAWERRYIRPVI